MFILDPIRAVVMEGRVILMTPPEGMDRWHKALEQHLRSYDSYNGNDEYANDGYTTDTGTQGTQGTQGSGRGDDDAAAAIPFALHAYEAILTAVQALYAYEYTCIQRDAAQVLAHFNAGTGSILPLAVQEKMRTMKNDASRLATRVEGFGRAIASLVSDYVDRLLPYPILSQHLSTCPLPTGGIRGDHGSDGPVLYERERALVCRPVAC